MDELREESCDGCHVIAERVECRDPIASDQFVPLNYEDLHRPGADINMLDLDEPLNRLADFDGRKSRIADLWFLDGLSVGEIGALSGPLCGHGEA
jgi:hypothetical protein